MPKINVTSEITPLRQLIIHSPGGEMNNMLPSKRDEWLIDDILETEIIQEEYSRFAKILLLFLDPSKIVESEIVGINPNKKNYHKSEIVIDAQYKLSQLFADLRNEKKSLALIEQVAALEKLHFKRKVDLIKLYEAAKVEYENMKELCGSKFMSLIKTLITGKLEWQWVRAKGTLEKKDNPAYIFKPAVNFMFTRDIGVSLNDHFLITKTADEIRHREVVLMKYIAECYLFKSTIEDDEYNEILDKVIEISEDDDYFQYDKKEQEKIKVNFEGGDIMMVSPRHLLIGKSQRTSINAINKLIHTIFEKDIGIELISVIKIAENRSQMHIDTILTHVKENVWMLYGRLSKKVMNEESEKDNMLFAHNETIEQNGATSASAQNEFVSITQFYCRKGGYKDVQRTNADFYIYADDEELKGLKLSDEERKTKKTYEKLPGDLKYTKPDNLESLLSQISRIEYNNDFQGEVEFVYSGDKEYPFDEREQWSDACNLLCLGNGVVIGYDRNRKTAAAFDKVMNKINGENVPSSNKKLFDFVENKKQGKEKMYCIASEDLFQYVKENFKTEKEINNFTAELKDLLITIPSGELSRARGGSHCMSMPLKRDKR